MSRKHACIALPLAIVATLVLFTSTRAISNEQLENMLNRAIQTAWPIDGLTENACCRELVITADKSGASICLALAVEHGIGELIIKKLSYSMGDEVVVIKPDMHGEEDKLDDNTLDWIARNARVSIEINGIKEWRTDRARHFIRNGNNYLCWRYCDREEIYYIYLLKMDLNANEKTFKSWLRIAKTMVFRKQVS